LSVDPEEAPGRSAPTVESLLGPADLDGWIDTVFSGFSSASGSPFMLVNDGSPDLVSRALFRFNAPILDSIFVIDTLSAALRYDSLRVVVAVVQDRSQLASGGTTLQLRAVGDEWDPSSATWDFAVDSPGVATAWSAGPGGSLGVVLSEISVSVDTLDLEPDSLIFDLTEFSDSLLNLWADTAQANTGLGIVVADSGRLVLGIPRLQYNIIPEVNPDTAIEVACPSATSIFFCFPQKTYIFDQTTPLPLVGALRVGGVEGWRSFNELTIPDSVRVIGSSQKQVIRQSTVSRAELLISSLQPAGPPLWAEADLVGTVIRLNDDFTILGPKTPVGATVVTAPFDIEVDSLQAGSVIAIDITRLIQEWAAVPLDSAVAPVRFLIRARPEGTTFGFWEFGSTEAPPALRPFLRVVFTPDTEFAFP
jgi:hypothetical protein